MQRDFLRIFLRPWSEFTCNWKNSRFDGAHEQLPSVHNTYRCIGWNEFWSLLMFPKFADKQDVAADQGTIWHTQTWPGGMSAAWDDLPIKKSSVCTFPSSISFLRDRSKGLFMPVHGSCEFYEKKVNDICFALSRALHWAITIWDLLPRFAMNC